MDEPTSGVDVRTRHEVLHLLDDLHHDGLAVVLTTHDLNGIAAHLPHLVCLNTRGRRRGPPRRGAHPRGARAHLRRAHGDPRARSGMPIVLDHRSPRRAPYHHDADRELTMDELLHPFEFEFFRNGVVVATLAGALCGLVGVYVVLKGMSYIGHGLSHAIFGGFAASTLLGVNFVLGAGTVGRRLGAADQRRHPPPA